MKLTSSFISAQNYYSHIFDLLKYDSAQLNKTDHCVWGGGEVPKLVTELFREVVLRVMKCDTGGEGGIKKFFYMTSFLNAPYRAEKSQPTSKYYFPLLFKHICYSSTANNLKIE